MKFLSAVALILATIATASMAHANPADPIISTPKLAKRSVAKNLAIGGAVLAAAGTAAAAATAYGTYKVVVVGN
ncbi:hypothetical protein BJ085DRAFT_38185 [Dimargaris cristalligena]|uniref:Uncharacterized protein n=1 Tax=Dimargaris cristalligena TaxID=215637 RepID=A0A4V1J516_9FUNG|nr:hypothetical protein BJ085DRAFT_38185 [Dimargaris cristalligena]|eukprot:RKP37489.1 hypothetical protein BJ085DRAFT_38185 [Dimargaris cristalligena]